jgi:hypothetical protein
VVTEGEIAGIVLGAAALGAAIYAIIDIRKRLKKMPDRIEDIQKWAARQNNAQIDAFTSALAIVFDNLTASHGSLRTILRSLETGEKDQELVRLRSLRSSLTQLIKQRTGRVREELEVIRMVDDPRHLKIRDIVNNLEALFDESQMSLQTEAEVQEWLGVANNVIKSLEDYFKPDL